MGYILPITHHTYKNYQYRMRDKKDSPHHIGATYKVVFYKVSNEHDFSESNAYEKKIDKEKYAEKRYITCIQNKCHAKRTTYWKRWTV